MRLIKIESIVKPTASSFAIYILVPSVIVLASSLAIIAQSQLRQPRKSLVGKQVRLTARVPVERAPTTAPETVAPTTVAPTTTQTSAASVGVAAGSRPPDDVLVGAPKRISIPSIGVNAVVVSVGLESDGSMEIPGVSEAGWYHFGARPGEQVGSAVIAAHVDHNGAPGVFINLTELSVGAQVSVIDQNGSIRHFEVTERYQVDKRELPGTELFRVTGPPTLTLITCGGSFDNKARRYSDNIVVRATPI
jgi:LPXTG-site transpeptidase (sortase) family protein